MSPGTPQPLVRPAGSRVDPPEKPRAVFWMRFKSGREPDCRALTMLVDATGQSCQSSASERRRPYTQPSTREGYEPPAGSSAGRTRHVAGGLHEEDFEIWDSTGTLVGEGPELAVAARTQHR